MAPELAPLSTAVDAAVGLDLGVVPVGRVPALAAEMVRQAHRLLAVAAQWVERAERNGGLAGSTYSSAADYLADHCGIGVKTARAQVALGTPLNEAPVLADAVVSGAVSIESAAVVATVVGHHAFSAHGDELVEAVKGLRPGAARMQVDRWRHEHADAEDPAADDEARRDARRLSFRRRPDGDVEIEGLLPRLAGAQLENLLRDVVGRSLNDGSGRTYAQRMADTLIGAVTTRKPRASGAREGDRVSARNSGSSSVWRGPRTGASFLVVISYDNLFERAGRPAWTTAGDLVSPADVERLVCEANLHLVVQDAQGQPLYLGSGVRFAPRSHWLALILRDGGCRWLHCHAPPEECIVHHEPEMPFGETDVRKEVLLCDLHHFERHRRGTTAVLDPITAAYTVQTAEGFSFTTLPRLGTPSGRAA